MTNRSRLLPLVTFALLVAACSREREPQSTKAQSTKAPPAATKSESTPPSAPPEAVTQRAPDTLRVRFETSKGRFVVEAYRDWAPNGVDRFYDLARTGYFDGARFYRVISGFMAQFGAHRDPKVNASWEARPIPDDSVKHSNTRGVVTFAARPVPNSRTTQLFVNYGDNANLDRMGFAPIGRVIDGMSVVDKFYSGYGEGAPDGLGPDQGKISEQGNVYLQREFPKLDYIVKATVVQAAAPSAK